MTSDATILGLAAGIAAAGDGRLAPVLLELMETRARLRALLDEARADLTADVDATYPHREYYPGQMRGYNRAMDLPRRIADALGEGA